LGASGALKVRNTFGGRSRPGAKALSAFEIAESYFKPSRLGYHADAPFRRVKTHDELIEGGEFFELADRRTRRMGGASR
jgi:hypothetical protein